MGPRPYPPGMAIVLYGVASPIVVDVEESVSRAGLRIAGAVHNVAGEPRLLDTTRLIDPQSIGAELLKSPFLVPLFTPGNRQLAAMEALSVGFVSPFTLVDPTAIVPSAWTVGNGVYINSGCTIGAATHFADFVFVNRGACIGHNVMLECFVSIGPGAVLGGLARIGKGTLVGAGAVVLPEVRVGENAVIGAGAVVTEDIPDHALAVGNPARVVRTGIAGYKDLTVA